MDAMQQLLERDGLLTVREVAQFLHITPAHVRKMLASGRLRGYLAEGFWRINPSDLVLYLEERRN
jgi:excisionase family DNA binding protein